MEAEINARISKAKGRVTETQRVWQLHKLMVEFEMHASVLMCYQFCYLVVRYGLSPNAG
jgi:hypothetical protein